MLEFCATFQSKRNLQPALKKLSFQQKLSSYKCQVLRSMALLIVSSTDINFLITSTNLQNLWMCIIYVYSARSILIGNIYIYFSFAGETYISSSTRIVLFIVLTVVSAIGMLTMIAFRPVTERRSADFRCLIGSSCIKNSFLSK